MKTKSKKAALARGRKGREGRASHGEPVANGAIGKVVVIGGSAGGIKSLCEVIRGLPGKLPAPLLAVVHMAEGASRLPQVLRRCGPTEIIVPDPAEPMLPGRLYLPRPNHHLIVRNGCAGTVMGPRESRHRPSVNTLFRCVARAYRSQVIGVILSGALDDGTAGALAVSARGGILIVEDPATAEVPDMPRNVILAVKPDYCLPVGKIAGVLCRLLNSGNGTTSHRAPTRRQCADEMEPLDREMEPQGISCPECEGVLAEMGDAKSKQFRCHVGHTFSLQSLTEAHADAARRDMEKLHEIISRL